MSNPPSYPYLRDSGTCPLCSRGYAWRSPDGGIMWLCGKHQKIIANTPGWDRVPAQDGGPR